MLNDWRRRFGTVNEESVQIVEYTGRGKSRDKTGYLQEKNRVLLLDLLAAALLAYGLSISIFSVTLIDAGILRNSAIVLGWLVVFLLFSCYPLPCTGIVGVLVLFAAAAIWRSGRWRELFQDVQEFWYWVFWGTPKQGPFTEEADTFYLQMGLNLLGVLIIGALFLVFYIMVRKIFRIWILLPVLVAGYLAVNLLAGPVLLTGFCISLAGVIIVLPRILYGAMLREDPENEKIGRSSLQILAVPAALVCIGLAAWLIPEDTSGWQSPRIALLLDDLSMYLNGPLNGRRPFFANFRLRHTGFMPLESRLGGNIYLNDDKALYLRSDEPPVWLKGIVSDTYTGHSWRDGENDGDFRYQSRIWRSYREEVFSGYLPVGGSEVKALYEKVTMENSYTLEYAGISTNTVFTGGIMSDYRLSGDIKKEQLYFDVQGEAFFHKTIRRGTEIELRTRRFVREAEEFEGDMKQLEALITPGSDPHYPEIAEKYLQLPDSVRKEASLLAEEVTAKQVSPFEKALAIESWLAQNCTYTLQPGEPPEEADFVLHFLESREGYCTYYASAMAVLARAAGIPSRYVNGYTVIPGADFALEDGSGWLIQNSMAHAWVELYLEGIGWLDFDPLKWQSGEALGAQQESNIAAAGSVMTETEPAETAETAETPVPAESAVPMEGQEQDEVHSSPDGKAALIGIAAVIVFGLAALAAGPAILLRYIRNRYQSAQTARRMTDTGKRLEYYFGDILFLLEAIGIKRQAGETLAVYGTRVDRYQDLGYDMEYAAAAAARYYYGGKPPRPQELEYLISYHEALDRYYYEKSGRNAYLRKRLGQMLAGRFNNQGG